MRPDSSETLALYKSFIYVLTYLFTYNRELIGTPLSKAATAVTVNDLEGHSLVAGFFKCNPSNMCAAFYTISTDSVLARFLCNISRYSSFIAISLGYNLFMALPFIC